MIFYDDNGDMISLGRLEIVKKHNDFSDLVPNWIALPESRSANADESLVMAKGAAPNNIIETRLIKANRMDGVMLTISNYYMNESPSLVAMQVTDGSNVLEFKSNETNLGIYYNDSLIKDLSLKFTFNKDDNVSKKPKTLSILYCPLSKHIALLCNGYVQVGMKVENELDCSQLKLNLTTNAKQITCSEVELKIWKSI